MRVALILLLMLALAAVPGSLIPQTDSDPNGVARFKKNNPELIGIVNFLQLFDVYSSVWFSSIYILLFVSLIGCIVARTGVYIKTLKIPPGKTPKRLDRMPVFHQYRYTVTHSTECHRGRAESHESESQVCHCHQTSTLILEIAKKVLKKSLHRVSVYGNSVSAEKGYFKEVANLTFHMALLLLVILVGFGGLYGFRGQRIVTVGNSFANIIGDFDTLHPGRLFDGSLLPKYRMVLDKFTVQYSQDTRDINKFGAPLDYQAHVSVIWQNGNTERKIIRVNDPLRIGSENIYLLGNGYAPRIRVRNTSGKVVFDEQVPFIPQDRNMTSLGVIKIHQGLAQQLGMIGFFYPTQGAKTMPFFSIYPDLTYPVLTLNIYEGKLSEGDSVYTLNTDSLKEIAGGNSGKKSITLMPGQSDKLPGDLGRIEFVNIAPDPYGYKNSVARFVGLDIHFAPFNGYIFLAALLALGSLVPALFIQRRRLWVRVANNAVEIAGLTRGDEAIPDKFVKAFMGKFLAQLESANVRLRGSHTG